MQLNLDGSVVVQSYLTLIGEGNGSTVLNSGAESAAIAVLADGALTVCDMTINLVGG